MKFTACLSAALLATGAIAAAAPEGFNGLEARQTRNQCARRLRDFNECKKDEADELKDFQECERDAAQKKARFDSCVAPQGTAAEARAAYDTCKREEDRLERIYDVCDDQEDVLERQLRDCRRNSRTRAACERQKRTEIAAKKRECDTKERAYDTKEDECDRLEDIWKGFGRTNCARLERDWREELRECAEEKLEWEEEKAECARKQAVLCAQ